MKLYELTKILTDLENSLETIETSDTVSKEEIEKEIYLKLDQFSVQFDYKAEQIGKMILNYAADIQKIKLEENRLRKKCQALYNRKDSLEKYLLGCMRQIGINKVKHDTLNIAIRQNPWAVVGEVNIEKLKPEFVRIIPATMEPDKSKILEHFRKTGEIPEGTNIARTERLEIK